jgi:C4-dicarboxylate-specific signal transduction histidine kinase
VTGGRVRPPFEQAHWKEKSWELFVYNPAPGVLFTRVSGHGERACAEHIVRAFDHVALTADKVEIFHDWELLNGYAAEVRVEMTAWTRGILHRLGSVHILVRSKIVAMGITIADVALGGVLTSHNDRRAFERVRAEATLRRRREADRSP